MKLRLPKYLFFVYQSGVMDCVSHTLYNARSMSCNSDDGDRSNYRIERWVKTLFHNLKPEKGLTMQFTYRFDKLIQKEKLQ